MQMDERNETAVRELLAQQFMDPGPSGGAHEASQSEDETQEPSTPSLNNSAGVGLEESDRNVVSIARKRPSVGEDSDQSPHSSWGANKSPKLVQPRTTDQATEYPCRKARVSVRARSDAPMVSRWMLSFFFDIWT